MNNLADIDENAPLAPDLPDREFVKSREAILRLLPRLFRDGSAKWSSLDVIEHFVDETVVEIARIWRDNNGY